LEQATYKTRSDFPSREAYADYVKSTLQIGMRLVAISGERKGDRGAYLGTNGGRPPCNVEWEDFGTSYWVEWHDVEIAGAVQSADRGVAAGSEVRSAYMRIGHEAQSSEDALKIKTPSPT
jgi:hypothetical protein